MRILIASKIHTEVIEKLNRNHEVVYAFDAEEQELKEQIKDCEVIIFRSGVNFSKAVMECSDKLRLIIRAGSGFDNVDLDYVRQKGLEFVRIPEPSAKAVSEMAFGLMLALTRNILSADRLLRNGHWIKHEVVGYLLTQKTLGIVGAGNIGSRVGFLGSAWGMKVMGCVKRPSSERALELYEQHGIRLVGFDEVISAADFVSIHVPLDASTRYMFNSDVFSRMKSGAFLINLARGGVVDENALYKALVEDKILRGAALDVHEKEGKGHISILADLPNVILTPHIGAQTVDSQHEIGERIVQIMEAHATEPNATIKDEQTASKAHLNAFP